jgi:hypothetical protein
VIVEEPGTHRAERFSAIVDAALAAWGARWPLYVLIAAASVSIELGTALLTHYDPIVFSVAMFVIDAFTMALVSLDVAARFREDQRPLRAIARAALRRWPAVAIVQVLILFIDVDLQTWLIGTPEQMLYGLLVLPALAAYGAFGITTVIASIDTSLPYIAIPGYAFLRGLMYLTAWPNLGRLAIGGAIFAVQMMLQILLEQWLQTIHAGPAVANFWSNAPIDAICVAPIQAFFTYLYLDFVVRDQQTTHRV